MKKVLLTGANGFFGSHLLQYILEKTDWNVVCVCSWEHKGTPERISRVLELDPKFHFRVQVITHDLSAPFTPMTKRKIGFVDYILNIASDSHVNRSIEEPVSFIQNNVNLALTLLEFAREIKPRLFLQFSTDEVYGVAPEDVNHKEWSSIVPSNPYSASKAAQEAIAISYWRTYSVPVVITNTMNLFGETQDPEKYTAQLITKIKNDELVTVHGSKEKIGSRFYIHARNAADAVLFIVNTLPATLYDDGDNLLPDRYNIVGDLEINNFELAEMVAKILKKELRHTFVDFHKGRPGHDRRYALDGTKLKEKGWIAPSSFEDSLKETIEWTLKNPEWMK